VVHFIAMEPNLHMFKYTMLNDPRRADNENYEYDIAGVLVLS